MPRTSKFEPTELPSRKAQGLAAWVVNVPAHLSETGKRQQLFFDTKKLADIECSRIKAKKDRFGLSLMNLSQEQLQQATAAFKLLDPFQVELLDAVNEFISGHKQRTASISFKDLFEQFLATKSDRNPAYLRELRITLNRFPDLHGQTVCDITSHELDELLAPLSPGARNPILRYWRAVFNHGIKRGYLIKNPVGGLDFVRRPRKEVTTVPFGQVTKMLHHALKNDLELLPYLTLGFFCGIRPDGELPELEWSDIVEGQVVIRPEVSKTNRRRFVDLSDNAKAWLSAYVALGGIMAGKVTKYNESELRTHRTTNWSRAVGVTEEGKPKQKWPQQGMRHTYCSNWLAQNKDVNKLVLQSGHDSVDTMWRAYHKGVTEAEAAKFWAINPPKRGASTTFWNITKR
jgi:integrase